MRDRNDNPVSLGGSCLFHAKWDTAGWRKGTVRQLGSRGSGQHEARVDDGDPAIEDPRENGARMMAWVTQDNIVMTGEIPRSDLESTSNQPPEE